VRITSLDVFKNNALHNFWQDVINSPPFNYRVRHIFAELCNTIHHQPMKLESCSNPLRIQQVFYFRLKSFFFVLRFLGVTS